MSLFGFLIETGQGLLFFLAQAIAAPFIPKGS